MSRDLSKRPNIIYVDDIEDCEHSEKKIEVLESWITCELSVLKCKACGKELEQPKTEC